MKVLILFLVLAISIQPLQAGSCAVDMGKAPQGQHQTSHKMDHEMDHEMDHSGGGGHDCCKTDGADSPHGCDNTMNCGFCFVHASALPSVMKLALTWEHNYSVDFTTGLVLPSHSSPPFRPPIC